MGRFFRSLTTVTESWRRRNQAIARRLVPAGLVLVYSFVGAPYTAVTPAWEAPDEPWHLAYAEALARGTAPTAADTYEAHQAPGYYLGLALVIRAIGVTHVPRATGSPYYPWSDAAYWHPPGGEGDSLVAVLRTVSGFLAAAAVAITWTVGRRLAPSDPGVAHLAAGTVALLPQYQHIGHSLSNDAAAAVCGGILVYVGTRLACGPWRRGPAALAAASAVVVLAKATAWPMAVAPAVGIGAAVAAGAVAKRDAARTASAGLLGAFTAVAALSLWLPSVPPAMLSDMRIRGAGVHRELMDWRILGALARETLVSAWGRFGWLSVDLPRATTWAAGGYGAAGLLGWAASFRGRLGPSRRSSMAAMAAVAAAWAAWAKNVVADPQPQGRLLYGALAAAAALTALGWRARIPARFRGPASIGVLGLMLAANVIAVSRTLPDSYRPWLVSPSPVVEHVLPSRAVVAARLRGSAAAAQQTFRAATRPSDVAVAVHAAEGDGTIRLVLTDSRRRPLATSSFELSDLRENRWIHVRVPAETWRAIERDSRPAPPSTAFYTLDIRIVRGDGELQLWGAIADVYDEGALTVDGVSGTDLSLIVLGYEQTATSATPAPEP